MKKYVIAMLVWLYAVSVSACDVCGCASMSIGLGDLSLITQNRISLRYAMRQFNLNNGTSDYYNQVSINGAFQLSSRWQMEVELPYINATRTSGEADDSRIAGLGDSWLRLRYFLLIKEDNNSTQRFGIGVGLNLPTGTFENRSGTLLPQNFQSGTGSWDYALESQYQLSYVNWTFGLRGSYLVNSINSEAYKFGNQWSGQLVAAHKIEGRKSAWMPLLGISYEHFDRDINSRGYYQYGTGGSSINALAGVNWVYNTWYTSLKIGESLGSVNNSTYTPGLQLTFSFNYLF